MKTLAAAALALFCTASALAVVEQAWRSPDRLAQLFLYVEFAGTPAALYLAFCTRGWMVLRAKDRIGWNGLLVEAHVIGLVAGALALALVLTLAWIYSGYKDERVLDLLPKGTAGAAAGGLGLAWGALWKLPNQEEAA